MYYFLNMTKFENCEKPNLCDLITENFSLWSPFAYVLCRITTLLGSGMIAVRLG